MPSTAATHSSLSLSEQQLRQATRNYQPGIIEVKPCEVEGNSFSVVLSNLTACGFLMNCSQKATGPFTLTQPVGQPTIHTFTLSHIPQHNQYTQHAAANQWAQQTAGYTVEDTAEVVVDTAAEGTAEVADDDAAEDTTTVEAVADAEVAALETAVKVKAAVGLNASRHSCQSIGCLVHWRMRKYQPWVHAKRGSSRPAPLQPLPLVAAPGRQLVSNR